MSGNKARHHVTQAVRESVRPEKNYQQISVVFPGIGRQVSGIRNVSDAGFPIADLRVQASFADLVVLAEEFHPIPFRTRPLKPPAPMVLRLKPRESRSLPVLLRTFAFPVFTRKAP